MPIVIIFILFVALLLLRILVWKVSNDPSLKYHFAYDDRVVSLIALFMLVDGVPSKSELTVVKKYLRVNYKGSVALKMLKALRERIKAYRYTKYVPDDDFFVRIGHDLSYPQRLLLYVLLSRLLAVDKDVAQETVLLERYARLANIPYSDVLEVKKFYAKYAKSGGVLGYFWALRVLKLKESASLGEAEKRFRELREENHPIQLLEMPYTERVVRLNDYLNYNEAYYTLMSPESINRNSNTRASNGGGETKYQSYYRKGGDEKMDKERLWALKILDLSEDAYASDEKIQAAFVKAMKQYPPSNFESEVVKRRRRDIEKAYRILMK